jgi:Tol biopolymer transport system component
MKIIYRFFWLFLVPLMAIGCNSIGVNPVVLQDDGRRVGVLGPIILSMDGSYDELEIENNIHISPNVNLNVLVNGRQVELRPEKFFTADTTYHLSLNLVPEKKDGKNSVSNLSWEIKTNPACLLYIQSAVDAPEVWKYCLDSQEKTQISSTDGHIQSFDPSSNGRWIVYSVLNEAGGTDIWIMNREGGKNRKLYGCEKDTCSGMKFINDGMQILFARQHKVILNGDPPTEILLLDQLTQKATTLPIGEKIQPSFLDVSTDEKYLSFFEQYSAAFWIYDIEHLKLIAKIPSGDGLGGSWNRKSGSLIYSQMVLWGGIPYGEIMQWDPSSDNLKTLFGGKEEQYEYFLPQWRPESDWIAIGVRPIEGSASRQIILISSDGEKKIEVINDQSFSSTSFSWGFDGETLVFQRFQLGKSNAVPEIGLWRMQDRSFLVIQKNAIMPKWLP